ncbi:MAG: outer membrane beta-barrel protein [Solirubrobacterales bacterium]|nr:outer membrane beta-barrel protein [Solirubrobacterales bacterium]
MPNQDQTDWTAGGGATITVGEDRLTLGAAHLSLHQAPGDLDALPTDQPVAYQVDDARLGYAHALGRLTLEPSFDAAAWRFGSATIQGVPASQAYRNRDVIQGGLTIRYEMAPQRDLVLALRGADQLYVATPQGAASPDSRSVAVLAGIEQAIDGLWRYRVLAGYPGFAVTGHMRWGLMPQKPRMSWVFAAAAADNARKT